MNKKRIVSTLIVAWLLFCCTANTLAYGKSAWYVQETSTVEEQKEPEVLSYTTHPTYYGMESMTNAMLACTF